MKAGDAKRRKAEIAKLRETQRTKPLKPVRGRYQVGQVYHFKDAKARAAALQHCPELAGRLNYSAAVTEAVKDGKIPHAMVRPVNVAAEIKLAMPAASVRPSAETVLRDRIAQQKIKDAVNAKERAENVS